MSSLDPEGLLDDFNVRDFEVPESVRSILKQVVAILDSDQKEVFIDSPDALQFSGLYGGRLDGRETFKFHYFPSTNKSTAVCWDLTMYERELREIASGEQTVLKAAEYRRIMRAKPKSPEGVPLLVWGPTLEDACFLDNLEMLELLLRGLRGYWAEQGPGCFRFWTARDDLLQVALTSEECRLEVVWSNNCWATSRGDASRVDGFVVKTVDGGTLSVSCSECLSWQEAHSAILEFARQGQLPSELRTSMRMAGSLLAAAVQGRARVLSVLGSPSSDPLTTSLGSFVADLNVVRGKSTFIDQKSALAFARMLRDGAHVELEYGVKPDDLAERLQELLEEFAEGALHLMPMAEALADSLSDVDGIAEVWASGREIQQVLRVFNR